MTLKLTTSLRAPNVRIVVPSHTRLVTADGLMLARLSSRVTLSPPSFAHAAVIAEGASIGVGEGVGVMVGEKEGEGDGSTVAANRGPAALGVHPEIPKPNATMRLIANGYLAIR